MGERIEDWPEPARTLAIEALAQQEAQDVERRRQRDPALMALLERDGRAIIDHAIATTFRLAKEAGLPTPRPRGLFDAPTREERHEAHVDHGRRAVRKGAGFEKDVQKAVKAMRDLGIADLDVNRPGMRVEWGQNARGERVPTNAFHTAKGSTDLTGCVRGGQYVRVELKACRGGRMNIQQYVKPHQQYAMDRAIQFGGLGFLLIRFDAEPARWYLFPWQFARERSSLVPNDFYEADALFLQAFVRRED